MLLVCPLLLEFKPVPCALLELPNVLLARTVTKLFTTCVAIAGGPRKSLPLVIRACIFATGGRN